MAAVPFKAILKFSTKAGTFQYPCTCSDVTAAAWVFPDAGTDVSLPGGQGTLALWDVNLSAAGTDTSQTYIYVNGKDTGERVLHAANLGTNQNRQFIGSPIYIEAGARLKLVQIT